MNRFPKVKSESSLASLPPVRPEAAPLPRAQSVPVQPAAVAVPAANPLVPPEEAPLPRPHTVPAAVLSAAPIQNANLGAADVIPQPIQNANLGAADVRPQPNQNANLGAADVIPQPNQNANLAAADVIPQPNQVDNLGLAAPNNAMPNGNLELNINPNDHRARLQYRIDQGDGANEQPIQGVPNPLAMDANAALIARDALNAYKTSPIDKAGASAILHASIVASTNSGVTFGIGLGAGITATNIGMQQSDMPDYVKEVFTPIANAGGGAVLAGAANLVTAHGITPGLHRYPHQLKPIPADLLVPNVLLDALPDGEGARLRADINRMQAIKQSTNTNEAALTGAASFGMTAAGKELMSQVTSHIGPASTWGIGIGLSAGAGAAVGVASGLDRYGATVDLPRFTVTNNRLALALDGDGQQLYDKVNIFYPRVMSAQNSTDTIAAMRAKLPTTTRGNRDAYINRVVGIGAPLLAAGAGYGATDAAATQVKSPESNLALKAIGKAASLGLAVIALYRRFIPVVITAGDATIVTRERDQAQAAAARAAAAQGDNNV